MRKPVELLTDDELEARIRELHERYKASHGTEDERLNALIDQMERRNELDKPGPG